MTNPIEVHSLSKLYRQSIMNSTEAVHDLSLSVERGMVYGLLGRNGSGKTTTIKIIMGLLHPSSGQVSMYGVDAWDPPVDVRRKIGYVSEKQILDPSARVQDLIKFCAGFYPQWNWEFCNAMMKQFLIPPARRVKELSHGTQRELALICAMGHRPELLVLDEPASGLDTVARREILDLLGAFVHEQGGSILISSHILTDLERIVSHVGIIHRGHLVLSGALDELKEHIQRVRIIFADDGYREVALSGQLRVQRSGREALATVKNLDPSELESFCRSTGARYELSPINLEELFIDTVEPALSETGT